MKIKRILNRFNIIKIIRIKKCEHDLIKGSFGSFLSTDYFTCKKCGLYCDEGSSNSKLFYKLMKKAVNGELEYKRAWEK